MVNSMWQLEEESMKHVRSHACGLLIAALLFCVSASAHLASGTDNPLVTSTTYGRYTTTAINIGTAPPRQIGITVRLDF